MQQKKSKKRLDKFQSFESYKQHTGIESDAYFLEDIGFKRYVEYVKKNVRTCSFLFQEIVFRCLPYPSPFTRKEVELISENFGIEEELVAGFFIEFIKAGYVSPVSSTKFIRERNFCNPY